MILYTRILVRLRQCAREARTAQLQDIGEDGRETKVMGQTIMKIFKTQKVKIQILKFPLKTKNLDSEIKKFRNFKFHKYVVR